MTDPRAQRAASRRGWAVQKHRLGDEPGDDLSTITTATERLAMMWPLAVEAWSLTGRAIPEYERSHIPVKRIPPNSSA